MNMSTPLIGNPDRDFAVDMLSHHEVNPSHIYSVSLLTHCHSWHNITHVMNIEGLLWATVQALRVVVASMSFHACICLLRPVQYFCTCMPNEHCGASHVCVVATLWACGSCVLREKLIPYTFFPYAQTAVNMADVEILYGTYQPMVTLAKEIVKGQTQEIQEMRSILSAQYATSA